jgi:hypothetical protein
LSRKNPENGGAEDLTNVSQTMQGAKNSKKKLPRGNFVTSIAFPVTFDYLVIKRNLFDDPVIKFDVFRASETVPERCG